MQTAKKDATEAKAAPAKEGHNSKRPRVGGIAVDQLKGIIARVERLEEEKAALGADIRDVFAEAKGNGFDVKAIRKIIKLRCMDASEREEEETVLDTYMHALGMIPDLFDGQEPPEDKAYTAAREIVIRDQKASTSYLQRVMTIGYNRAAGIIEQLEREGVVSAADHIGKREVLQKE